ncbi:uncharacterized protein C2orf73 homolog [Littorina saxatilis]|uniref:Uncharacterized protein n=1 Tax=Littorina saxatilis TaxID=31220 RepID=A0AAN9BFA0_9CAEN
MTLYMPPLQRKKPVSEKYNPDSFRVISNDAETTHPKFEPQQYRATFEPPTPSESLFPEIANCRRTRVLPKPTADYRANNPHPKSCSFIRTDVRLLNEPVCTVFTKDTHSQQQSWWPSRPNKGTLEKGEYTTDTTYRDDFIDTRDLSPPRSTRHASNPNTQPARGIAPVNFLREKDGSQGFYREAVSFEHMYNSRKDPNYHMKTKRHGCYVYSKVDPEAKRRFIEYHTKRDMEETQQLAAQTSHSAKNQMSPSPRAACQPLSAPSPQRTPNTTSTVPSPKMMPTRSSPIEFYDPTGRILQ